MFTLSGGGVFKLQNGTWVIRGVTRALFSTTEEKCEDGVLGVFEDVNVNRELIEFSWQ